MVKYSTSLLLVILCFVSTLLFSQGLPLKLYWAGKTDGALLLAKKTIEHKGEVSKKELAQAYDFMAEYSLEHNDFKNNLNYLHLLFTTSKNTSLDSALHYARLAHYTLLYLMNDSTDYYYTKAIGVFKSVCKTNKDSTELARYYSYLGNAARNTIHADVHLLDSAIAYSNNTFLKAQHYRRYATFLTDLINVDSEEKRKDKKVVAHYKKCIRYLTIAEKLASQIYPTKKSISHATIYKIWLLAERYAGNEREGIAMAEKGKNALEYATQGPASSEYSGICSWQAAIYINLFDKTDSLKFMYAAEKTLVQSIPAWEKYLETIKENSIKSMDDQYSINPYQKLIFIYFQLYKATHNKLYIARCNALIEFVKNKRNEKSAACDLSIATTTKKLDSISKMCQKKSCAIINYFATSGPDILLAIVSLPDSTLLIECSNNKNIKTVRYFDLINIINSYVLKNDLKSFKIEAFELYGLFFAKIDVELQKNKINDVVVLPDMSWSGLNFDFLQTDSSSKNSIFQPALIRKYKFTYATSAKNLLQSFGNVLTYKQLNVLQPLYNSSIYAQLHSSDKLINKLCSIFNVDKINTDNVSPFFEKNKLNQFIGHAKTNSKSTEQFLILSDTTSISSSTILKNNLEGSSYLLNACSSNTGKEERYDKINSLPYQLINQHASAVIISLWPLDDRENAEFLEVFYTFMAEDLAASDALYKTKLFFLEKGSPPAMWSAYLYYGPDFYLQKKEPFNLLLYVCSFFIILIVLLLYFRYIKKRRAH
jgi:CHAT domain-containing protein